MKLARNTTLIIHHILDQWLPPFVRDSRLLMYPVFRMFFGEHAGVFMEYKDRAPFMDENEIRDIYLSTASANIQRKTDINEKCLEMIEKSVVGSTVLDIACGRGYLAGRLAERFNVTGADFAIDCGLASSLPRVVFREADICRLPFADNEFDTVISAHTLEHIPDIHMAASELRRVAHKRLIIVVPRQRPYRYTFDLHLHFFPYAWSLQVALGYGQAGHSCSLVGGDWFYLADLS